MKKILSCGIALFASVAFGATTVPVQLINPSGSTSGQAVISTGPSSAPAWGSVPTTGLASQAANTVLANFTASSASPVAFTMPSCSSSGSALLYTSGTGVSCGSNFAMTTGATFSGAITPSQTAGIVGTTTNNNANTGSIGEYISAQVLAGSAISLTTATATNVTSLPLTAGDWDVSGTVCYHPAATTNSTVNIATINTTSATLPTLPNGGAMNVLTSAIAVNAGDFCLPTGSMRQSVSGTTTVYLIAESVFNTSTNAAYGFIGARRRR